MPQLFSILEFTDPAGDVLATRLPADGAADIEWGAQLVVRESQTALLLKDGQLVHTFGPGRYTLDTQNLPVLGKFVTGLVFGKGNTPFKAEVYFVARHLFRDLRWGTPEPVFVVDPVMGQVPVRGHGRFAVQVADPLLFCGRMVGTRGVVRAGDLEGYLREQYLVSALIDGFASLGKPMVELPRYLRELGGGVKALLASDFASLGLTLCELSVNAVNPTEEYAAMMSDAARTTSRAHATARGTQFDLEARAAGAAALRDAGTTYRDVAQADALKTMAEKSGAGVGGTGGEAGGLGLNAGLNLGATMAAAQMIRDAMASTAPSPAPVVAAATAPVSAPPPGVDPVAKIKQLKELLDLGAITQEEFDAKKREYLKML